MAIKGGAARLLMMGAYFLAFCCSIIITGAFAWFTARETRGRNLGSLVMGIASTLWSFTNFLLVCCAAGVNFLAVISIVVDTLFFAVMIAIAVLNRSATNGCSRSPFPRVVYDGSGRAGCRLFVAAFAVAVICVFMYAFTAGVQFLIYRRNKKGGVREVEKGRRHEHGAWR